MQDYLCSMGEEEAVNIFCQINFMDSYRYISEKELELFHRKGNVIYYEKHKNMVLKIKALSGINAGF